MERATVRAVVGPQIVPRDLRIAIVLNPALAIHLENRFSRCHRRIWLLTRTGVLVVPLIEEGREAGRSGHRRKPRLPRHPAFSYRGFLGRIWVMLHVLGDSGLADVGNGLRRSSLYLRYKLRPAFRARDRESRIDGLFGAGLKASVALAYPFREVVRAEVCLGHRAVTPAGGRWGTSTCDVCRAWQAARTAQGAPVEAQLQRKRSRRVQPVAPSICSPSAGFCTCRIACGTPLGCHARAPFAAALAHHKRRTRGFPLI